MAVRDVAVGRFAARPHSLLDGAAGGIIGGILMGMISMILFPLLGYGGFFQPLNLMAALFNQNWGHIAGFAPAPFVVGMVIHMMMSIVLGVLFAWAVSRVTGGAVVVWAIVGALAVWAINHLLILPVLDPVMATLFPLWLFALSHVMYGAGLGGYLAWHSHRAVDSPTTASMTDTLHTDSAPPASTSRAA